MSPLLKMLVTATGSGALTGVSTWSLLHRTKLEAGADERVAEINASPDFAAQLAAALDRLDAERQLVAQLRIDLAQVTAERNVLGVQVQALSARLDETTTRLGELNEQFSALARHVQTQIPTQPVATD